MNNFRTETVLNVRHWTDGLFSFQTTRDPGFRFLNGQFTMIGLNVDGRPLLRAYSMASSQYEETLEFFSVKVPNGPLTSRLQHIKPGDEILVGRKPTGTLVLDNLQSGRVLYLLATGTGLAPFLSVIKDPEAYDRFDKIVLVHGCRFKRDLAYETFITQELPADDLIGDILRDKLIYHPMVTREPFRNSGRITTALENGRLPGDLNLPGIDPAHDRFMLCGSPAMLQDTSGWLTAHAFTEGNSGEPGQFVIEKAFVER